MRPPTRSRLSGTRCNHAPRSHYAMPHNATRACRREGTQRAKEMTSRSNNAHEHVFYYAWPALPLRVRWNSGLRSISKSSSFDLLSIRQLTQVEPDTPACRVVSIGGPSPRSAATLARQLMKR